MAIGDYLKRITQTKGKPPTEAELAKQARLNRKAKLRAARDCAAIVDNIINELDAPPELEDLLAFQQGIGLLADPCFDSEELLALSDNPAGSLWQMGVMAVCQHEPNADLVNRLLVMIDQGGPWQNYFVVKALLVHTPLTRSLAGELIFGHLRYDTTQALPFLIQNTVPVLAQRLEDGEVPSFGALLETLDTEKAAELQRALTLWLDSPLPEMAQTLQAELDHWQATFVDQDLLLSIGRIWAAQQAAPQR